MAQRSELEKEGRCGQVGDERARSGRVGKWTLIVLVGVQRGDEDKEKKMNMIANIPAVQEGPKSKTQSSPGIFIPNSPWTWHVYDTVVPRCVRLIPAPTESSPWRPFTDRLREWQQCRSDWTTNLQRAGTDLALASKFDAELKSLT